MNCTQNEHRCKRHAANMVQGARTNEPVFGSSPNAREKLRSVKREANGTQSAAAQELMRRQCLCSMAVGWTTSALHDRFIGSERRRERSNGAQRVAPQIASRPIALLPLRLGTEAPFVGLASVVLVATRAQVVQDVDEVLWADSGGLAALATPVASGDGSAAAPSAWQIA